MMNTQMSIKRSIAWTMKNYRKYVSFDDLTQLCEVYVLEHPQKIYDWEIMSDHGEAQLAEWQLWKELNKVLGRYARKEKATKVRYDTEDEQFYSLKAIGEMLPYVLAGDSQQPVTERSDVVTPNDPGIGGNWLAWYADVSAAWFGTELSDQERDIMVSLYWEGTSQASIADAKGVTRQAVARAHQRALEKLLEALGGPALGSGCPYQCECHGKPLRARPGVRGTDASQVLD